MFMSLISPKLTAQQSELYLLRKIIFILINIVLVGQWKYTGEKRTRFHLFRFGISMIFFGKMINHF